MSNGNGSPGEDRDDNQWNEGQETGDTPGYTSSSKSLETNGPDKSKPFNVLNQDGSLPDMPDEDAEGKGALDGTVGLGT